MTAARIAEHLNPDDGDAGVSLGHQQGCQSNLLAEVCPARGNNGDIGPPLFGLYPNGLFTFGLSLNGLQGQLDYTQLDYL